MKEADISSILTILSILHYEIYEINGSFREGVVVATSIGAIISFKIKVDLVGIKQYRQFDSIVSIFCDYCVETLSTPSSIDELASTNLLYIKGIASSDPSVR